MPDPRGPKADDILLAAEDVALKAVLDVARAEAVGEHRGASMVGPRLAAHTFACTDPGYPGWVWEVSLSRAPRSKTPTVCEVDLMPSEGALLAPPWVPWEDRLQPDDVTRDDVLPYNANDPRLIAGFEDCDEETRDVLGIDEIGYGRPRVLSKHGLDAAAERWYQSDRGPTPGLRVGSTCGTCGFLMKMGGSMGQVFGICANEWAQDDGSVVALTHGCGAHSETDEKKRRPQWPISPSRVDDFDLEVVEIGESGAER